MSQLKVYPENKPEKYELFRDFDEIAGKLKEIGVKFERWSADQPVTDTSTQDEILKAYHVSVEKLMKEQGFVTADVVSINPSTPNHGEFRRKFLSEHTHSEDEARFFIDGKGLFCIHENGHVYAMLCEKNDLINVPAGSRHWFDMGAEPFFKCIRMFSTQEGWVANFTGSEVAGKFPSFPG